MGINIVYSLTQGERLSRAGAGRPPVSSKLVALVAVLFLLAPLITAAADIAVLCHDTTQPHSSMPCHDETSSPSKCCCHGHSDNHVCQCNNGHCFGGGALVILPISMHEIESGAAAAPRHIVSMPAALSLTVPLRPPIIRL